MKKPFADLDPATIDTYIEQAEQQLPRQPASEDTRYLRDLQYLHRKDAILQRAAQRLQLVNVVDEQRAQLERSEEAGARYTEHSTLMVPPRGPRRPGFAWPKLVAVLAAVLLLLGALFGTSQFVSSRRAQTPAGPGATTPTTLPASATVVARILFSDPLTQNIHDFLVDSQHFFNNGAYHLADHENNGVATLADQTFSGPIVYTLTMEEITGDDASPTNAFGMIFNYTARAGKFESFYTFEIVNNGANSQYGFWEYDNNRSYPWRLLKTIKAGKEFRRGHGPTALNTLSVLDNDGHFTFSVNGVQVGQATDTSLQAGKVGMIVNLKGTEVAFTDMLVARP